MLYFLTQISCNLCIPSGSEFNISTTTKKTDVQSDETSDDMSDVNCTTVDDNQKVIGFLTEWIAAYKFITGILKCITF